LEWQDYSMEFDDKDKAIIEEFYHNWRITASQLSKKIRLSRRQVDYRIKQYFSSGAIRAIFTVLDYSKLGYKYPAYAFIRLKNKKDISEVGRYLEETKRCTSWGKVWTEYDIFSNFIFKNKKEKFSFIKSIKNRFKNKISNLLFIDPTHSELYPLKSINSNYREIYELKTSNQKKVKVDYIDLNIIKEIGSDSRKSVINIADQIRISPERCLYRLRRLFKEKIIMGSRIQFGLQEAGLFATCLFIDAKINNLLLDKMKTLCETDKNINYLLISKKSPQVIIQIFHKDEETLREIVKKVYSFFLEIDSKITIVELEDDINIVNPAPFL
jgi:Lrp/AsnC family transcriptional regulator, leucine-responsive regulatory protein